MNYKYFQFENLESKESIEEFNDKANILFEILQQKVNSEEEKDLDKYLFFVKDKAETINMSYLDLILKDIVFLQAKSIEITKLMNIFIRRMNNEIENADEKSTEISLNILNETHSRVSRNIRKIEKRYNSFYSIKKTSVGDDQFILYTDSYNKENSDDKKNQRFNVGKLGESYI